MAKPNTSRGARPNQTSPSGQRPTSKGSAPAGAPPGNPPGPSGTQNKLPTTGSNAPKFPSPRPGTMTQQAPKAPAPRSQSQKVGGK